MRIFNRMRMYGAFGPICSAQLPFQPALLQPGGKISPGTTKDDFCSRRRFLFFILKINRYLEENQGTNPNISLRVWNMRHKPLRNLVCGGRPKGPWISLYLKDLSRVISIHVWEKKIDLFISVNFPWWHQTRPQPQHTGGIQTRLQCVKKMDIINVLHDLL